MSIDLATPLSAVSGLGRARAALLAGQGMSTVEDLLWRLPYRYEDRSRSASIRDLVPGTAATVRVEVTRARLARTRRKSLTLIEAQFRDRTGAVQAVFFNQPYLLDVLVPGRELFLFGIPERRGLFLARIGVKRWGENSVANYGAYAEFMLKTGIIKQAVTAQELVTNDLIDDINRFDAEKIAAEARAYKAGG